VKLTTRHLLALVAIFLLAFTAGCSDRDPTSLPPAQGSNVESLVFDDAYHPDVYFQAFFQTNIWAVSIDSVYAYGGLAADGARSLKFNVAPENSALGLYTGGVLTSGGARDLAQYNALTFYARTTYPMLLDVIGFGNDNTGNSLFEAGRGNISLGPDWSFVVVPIPDPSKLRSERGMLTIAEALDAAHPEGYDIWLDEIRYANLGNIDIFRASMTPSNKVYFVGSTVSIDGTRTIFQIDGGFVPMDHSPGYFDYTSSDESVAVVDRGQVLVVGLGQASITATVQDSTDVLGTVTVTGLEPPSGPAPSPTLPAGDVVSLFSDEYNDSPVDTWRADWGGSTTRVEDYAIDGNNNKMYTSLNFVGIEFLTRTVDASTMTHFHMDVYAPEGTEFKVKLVSFPSETGAQTQDLVLDETTTPAFTAGGWSSLEIPLEDFQLPETGWDWGYIGQLVLSTGDAQLVLVDNIYFHK
jgi:hypothetical protein